MSEDIYQIISRKEAKALGLNKYFTGKPCKRGHLSERLTSDGCCVVCKKLRQKSDESLEYQKKYHKEQRENQNKKHRSPDFSLIHSIVSRKEAKTQGLKFYFTGKLCVCGHLCDKYVSVSKCVVCSKSDKSKDYNKKYRESDEYKKYRESDECKQLQKEYQKTDAYREYQKDYYKNLAEYRESDEYKESQKEYQKSAAYKKYRESDEFKESQKEYNKYYQRNRRSTDPLYRMTSDIRNLIKDSMSRGGFKKSGRTAQILGCSFEEFKTHIENQFTEGMNWDNHGKWHYDHIYPIAKRRDEAHLIELNHYTNFQPLWALDNILKSDNIPDGY
ncbi:hypothetical protein M0R04_07695 [Candidatus Dojkabacteria bacterium]|jgi:hypothetical protein|nr:hypothetical protein [Candidatus Dojkabacteria bacterium]